MATKPKPKPKAKTPQQLLTEKLMRGGKSRQQYDTEQRMRSNATASKNASAAARKAAEQQKLRDYYKANGHLPTSFANESKKRFGEADSADVSTLAADVANGRITKDEALRRIREGMAVNDPNKLRVGLDVNAELDPQLNAIDRRRKANRENLDYTLREDEAQSRRTAADVKGIYDALLTRLQAGGPQIAQQYGDASQRIAQQYATLQQSIGNSFGAADAATAAQVAGMQGGTTQAQTLGAQDASTLAGIAGIQNQGIQGQLAVGQQGEQNIQKAQTFYTGSQGAEDQASILAALNQRAAELRRQFGQEDTELQGQYTDLDESRFAKLYEGGRTLEQQQAQAIQDAEDRAYERDTAERALGIKEYTAQTGRYAIDAATERHNATLRQNATNAANKHNLEVRRLNHEIAKENDPVRRTLLQNQADAEAAKAAKYLADAQNVGKSGANGKPDKYTQGMSVIQNIPGIRPDQVSYLQKIVDSAAARADYDKFFITKGNDWMMNELNRSGYQNDAVRRYTRQALAIILGVV